MQVCPAGVGGCKWHKEVHWLICMRTKAHTRVTSVHMYGWLELCAHQLCVNICLCKDAHVGLGLAGVPVRSGYGHLCGPGAIPTGRLMCVCLRPGPMGSGGSVGIEGMCELRLVSAYVWEVGP